MSVSTEEVTNPCGNCGGASDGWVEIRLRSSQGIHLDVSLCDECKTAVNNALAGRRPIVEHAESVPEEVEHKESVDEAAWVSENVPPAKPQQSSRSSRRGNNKAVVEEKAPDAEPVQVDAPADTPPVDAETGSDEQNATDDK